MQYIRNLLVRQLLWMAHRDSDSILAPADADPAEMYMVGITARLFDTDLFVDPYEEDDYRLDVTAPLWHPVTGTLVQTDGMYQLLPADGSQPMKIHPNRCNRITDWDPNMRLVLLYDQKNPGTGDQILVTEAEYQLADPFFAVYDKAYMLSEYLMLEETEQNAVFLFLSDADYTEDIFSRLCHISLTACQSGGELSALPQVPLEDPHTKHFLKLLGFSDEQLVNDLWTLCTLLAVWELVYMFEEMEDCVTRNEFMKAETCCRHPALAECVKRNLPEWKADRLAQLLLSVESEMVDASSFACIRFWLFALLEARISLSRPILQEISRKHFCHPMNGRLLRAFRSSMFSSNAEVLRECVEAMYSEKCALHNSGIPAALAVMRIHDHKYLPDPIQEEAQTLLLEGTEEKDILLGIAMMAVYLQFRSEHIRSYREPVVLSRETEVIAAVLSWLRDPYGIYYSYVCELAYWLYLSSGVPGDAFADLQVVHAAGIAWNERIYPNQVEKLMSTLPMGMVLPQNDALVRMQQALSKRFDAAIRGKSSKEKTIRLFRCCAVLGCWEKTSLLFRFKYLLRKIDGNPENIVRENREYMRRLKWEMLQVMMGKTEEGDCFQHGLMQQKNLAIERSKEESACEQAECLLHAFRRMLYHKNADFTVLAKQFQEYKQEIHRTALITDWFYALCTMGLSQAALAFYLRHKDILDRPWGYLPDPMGLSVEKPYHAASCFWNGNSRREKGLELAAAMGHCVEQWSLVLQDGHDIYRNKQNIPQFIPDKAKVLRFFQTQHDSGKKQRLNYWMTHYDDVTATRMALEEEENHCVILQFGYHSSKEMALAAVEVDPSHVCYASQELLKDNQIAMTVLKQSCRYLHLLFAPVTENRGYIKKLILMQGKPVVLNRTKKWVRDDKELMLQSVRAYPQYFELVSERLRGDQEVVVAALEGAIRQTTGSYWLRHILNQIPVELLDNPQIIQCVKRRCPDYDRTDYPDILQEEESTIVL